jgi:lipid-A-disaccharide synthase
MAPEAMVLPPHPHGKVDVLFVAGEHSGDQHAALIAGELKAAHPGWAMSALGGPALEQAGVQLLHDLTKDSVVGLVEVLKHYGDFKRLFNALLDWIEAHQPRIVVLVDYPGFNLRLAAALRKRGLSRKGGGQVLVYQYVSPQIWAWKAGRRFKMAEVLDELGVIFPFEVDCYKDTDLPVRFVGHPFVREGFTNPLHFDAAGPVLLLPGSRQQAVGRIFPVMVEAVRAYRGSGGSRQCVCLYPEEGIGGILRAELARQAVDPDLIELKHVSEGTAASAVLTSSGTMSLNCALAGIPGAIVYRAHPFTVWMGRRLVKIDWLGIANLVLGREVYPEYLQGDARPDVLAAWLEKCLQDETLRLDHAAAAGELEEMLSGPGSTTVANRISHLLGDQPAGS